jgi:hypothetical protein
VERFACTVTRFGHASIDVHDDHHRDASARRTGFPGGMLGILALAGCVRTAAPTTNGADAPDASAPLSGVHVRAALEPGAEAVGVQMCFDGARRARTR